LEFPKESLGVGTFNHKQSQLILEMIDEECRSNRLAREAIEKLSSGKEPLFVKNLENLQGDERDRILISYTYGPDRSSGRVLNRFGPINSDNGWRRLNVLVTRARCRSLVFASFKFSDIIIGPNASKGLLAFKDYLEYSQSGKLPERAITGRLPQSGFEISVAKVVSSLGCHAEPQVGVAGYYIDIGVQILDGSGDFILGIECDGASYHSSKSARDRDRLREEVIVSRGWSLHRIWSTDWFQNREREEMRLADAIKSAMLIRKNRQR
jgi:very-short-patch-repair endonuclease